MLARTLRESCLPRNRSAGDGSKTGRMATTISDIVKSTTSAAQHRIVVGVDGSAESTRALKWAAGQAQRTHAVLEIHTVYVQGLLFVPPDEVAEINRQILDDATENAQGVAPTVTTQSVAHNNEVPANVLIEASNGADLLVVGTRGEGGILGVALGSVSQKCSLHAHCTVVIVR